MMMMMMMITQMGMKACAYNPSTWDTESEESSSQLHHTVNSVLTWTMGNFLSKNDDVKDQKARHSSAHLLVPVTRSLRKNYL